MSTVVEKKVIEVKFFAALREQSGSCNESIKTFSLTPLELYDELGAKYGFSLSHNDVKVAVNGEFEEMSYLLKNGDSLAFIPPMSGG